MELRLRCREIFCIINTWHGACAIRALRNSCYHPKSLRSSKVTVGSTSTHPVGSSGAPVSRSTCPSSALGFVVDCPNLRLCLPNCSPSVQSNDQPTGAVPMPATQRATIYDLSVLRSRRMLNGCWSRFLSGCRPSRGMRATSRPRRGSTPRVAPLSTDLGRLRI